MFNEEMWDDLRETSKALRKLGPPNSSPGHDVARIELPQELISDVGEEPRPEEITAANYEHIYKKVVDLANYIRESHYLERPDNAKSFAPLGLRLTEKAEKIARRFQETYSSNRRRLRILQGVYHLYLKEYYEANESVTPVMVDKDSEVIERIKACQLFSMATWRDGDIQLSKGKKANGKKNMAIGLAVANHIRDELMPAGFVDVNREVYLDVLMWAGIVNCRIKGSVQQGIRYLEEAKLYRDCVNDADFLILLSNLVEAWDELESEEKALCAFNDMVQEAKNQGMEIVRYRTSSGRLLVDRGNV